MYLPALSGKKNITVNWAFPVLTDYFKMNFSYFFGNNKLDNDVVDV